MKKTIFFTVIIAYIFSISSCAPKSCERKVTKPDGTVIIETYDCRTGATIDNQGCDNCGGSGTGTGTDYIIFNPNDTRYQPQGDLMTGVPAVVADNPAGNVWDFRTRRWVSDFTFRQQSPESYMAIPDVSPRDTRVDGGSTGTDNGKMWIWVFVPQFGFYIETMVSTDLVINQLQLGSPITITITWDMMMPFGVCGEPSMARAGNPMSMYSYSAPLYAVHGN